MGDKILRRQPERLGAEEVDDADHKGHYLADDRSQSRAGHSPVEAENKDRVQDDIYDGPGQHGGHRPGGLPSARITEFIMFISILAGKRQG